MGYFLNFGGVYAELVIAIGRGLSPINEIVDFVLDKEWTSGLKHCSGDGETAYLSRRLFI